VRYSFRIRVYALSIAFCLSDFCFMEDEGASFGFCGVFSLLLWQLQQSLQYLLPS